MNPDEQQEFDKRLQQKFEDFRPQVPDGLWDRIAQQLDADAAHPVVPIRAKRRTVPARWMIAAATLLVVCGVLHRQSRPVSVTYLHAEKSEAAATVVVPELTDVEPTPPATASEPATEALDLARLRQLFAKRNRKKPVPARAQAAAEVQELQVADPTGTIEPQQLAVTVLPATLVSPPAPGNEVAATVPDIEPLVVLEEEEETMLASTSDSKPSFGLSNILNYVVGTVDQRDEKLVTFSNDDEGSLKLDFNFGLAKNKKKKLK